MMKHLVDIVKSYKNQRVGSKIVYKYFCKHFLPVVKLRDAMCR